MFDEYGADWRFIPYVAMHEFEAMLFSDPKLLAEQLKVPESDINDILAECGEPENIDDSPLTAPSKRLDNLSTRFKKTSTGIAIAKAIGLVKIKEQCPLFNKWMTEIECLKGSNHGKAYEKQRGQTFIHDNISGP